MVEIERLVNGDLNKSIEQCVTLLMDVERKVHSLKNELAQTVSQLPGNRLGATNGLVGNTLPVQGSLPMPSYAPWTQPQTQTPYVSQENIAQARFGMAPYGVFPGSWGNVAAPFWGNYGPNIGIPLGIPYGTYGTYGSNPYGSNLALPSNIGLPYGRETIAHAPFTGFQGVPLTGLPLPQLGLQGVPSIPFQGVPYPTLPGFTGLPHQTIASPVPGYGYIW